MSVTWTPVYWQNAGTASSNFITIEETWYTFEVSEGDEERPLVTDILSTIQVQVQVLIIHSRFVFRFPGKWRNEPI